MSNEELAEQYQYCLDGGDMETANEILGSLFTGNAGMIQQIIKPFSGICDPQDLTQETFFPLRRAAIHYDPDRGASFISVFASYARWHLLRYVNDQVSPVRIPQGMRLRIGIVEKARSRLCESLGRSPTLSELASETNLNIRQLKDAEEVAKMAGKTISLDQPVNGADEADSDTLGDFIADPENPLDGVLDAIEKGRMRDVWGIVRKSDLTSREREILHLRYLYGKTVKESAEACQISPQRASQLEATALGKLLKNHKRELADLDEQLIARAYGKATHSGSVENTVIWKLDREQEIKRKAVKESASNVRKSVLRKCSPELRKMYRELEESGIVIDYRKLATIQMSRQ